MSSDQLNPLADHSVTRLIANLRSQDPAAAEEIWSLYFKRLLPLAQSRLKALPSRHVDGEDILVSVFDRFFRAAKQDRFFRLQDREDWWQILLMLTERKVADLYRAAKARKRGGADISSQSSYVVTDVRNLQHFEPGPEYVAAFNEQLARALQRLAEPLTREIALLRMEGYENREIADRLAISVSSVERKLRVVREVWAQEFADRNLDQ